MSDQEPSTFAPQRPRVVLRLVPPLPPEPPAPPVERVLIETWGLRLTRECLEVGGQTYRLAELRGFRTRRESPRLSLPLLLAGVCVTLAVPLLLAQPDSGPVYAALTGITGLVFASLLHAVVACERYGLILRTAEGDREVFHTRDHQRFARVVEALDAALVRRLPESSPSLRVVSP
ncbi:DUF6232 family protein [Hyalangium gracile]|uniref:DUF6232 family protein n=1 Tax=Hyalangium gracile TaxID=394092 RepID=UPI001CCAF96E|nr:DUF6232 family protein [Hyalangium gracile]